MADRRTMRKAPEVRIPPRSGFAIGPHFVAAVDAAKLTPAWALGHSGQLQAVGLDSEPGVSCCPGWPVNPRSDSGTAEPAVCVLEVSPPRGARDGNPHNIFEQNVGGALTAGSMRADSLVLVFPDEWAGQSKKPPRHWAIWNVLTPSERALVAEHFDKPLESACSDARVVALGEHIERACESLAYGQTVRYSHPVHNLLDAVGLFLFAVGRIKRGGGTRESSAPDPRVTFKGFDSGRHVSKVRVKRGRVDVSEALGVAGVTAKKPSLKKRLRAAARAVLK